jgi:hypothetical protein
MRWSIGIMALLALAWVAGCMEHASHTLSTGEHGSLRGLAYSPVPQSLHVDPEAIFEFGWQDGYEPPPEFTVALYELRRDGDRAPIVTRLEQTCTAKYRLEPVDLVPERTFLLLKIRSDEDEVRVIYLTTDGEYARTPRGGDGQAEHVVKTGTR